MRWYEVLIVDVINKLTLRSARCLTIALQKLPTGLRGNNARIHKWSRIPHEARTSGCESLHASALSMKKCDVRIRIDFLKHNSGRAARRLRRLPRFSRSSERTVPLLPNGFASYWRLSFTEAQCFGLSCSLPPHCGSSESLWPKNQPLTRRFFMADRLPYVSNGRVPVFPAPRFHHPASVSHVIVQYVSCCSNPCWACALLPHSTIFGRDSAILSRFSEHASCKVVGMP